MSGFEASLRSSPKPSKKVQRDGAIRGSPAATLKKALLNQQVHEASQLAASINNFKTAVPIGDTSRLWEPPLSCHRCSINVLTSQSCSTEKLYFPLEITTRDYINRLLRLLTCVVTSLCYHREYNSSASQDNLDAEFSELLVIMACNSKSIKKLVDSNKATELYTDLKTIPSINDSIKTILSVYSREVYISDAGLTEDDAAQQGESGKLSELNPVFAAVTSILTGIEKLSISNPKLTIVSELSNKAKKELEQLEQQHRLHRVFKDQRMAALGWLWPATTTPTALHSSFHRSLSFETSLNSSGMQNQVMGSEVKSDSEERAHWEQVHTEADEVTVQLQALLQPTTLANVQLFHRLVCIVQDLDVLMRALSADSEYQEAQRLRELKTIVDATVSSQGRALLDQVRQCCNQAQLLVGELRHYCDECRQRGGYYETAQNYEHTARELNALQRELRTNGISPFSLLSQPTIVERLSREGSSFVDSNFLFTEPHQQLQQRVLTGTGTSSELSPGHPTQRQIQALSVSADPTATLRIPGGDQGVGSGTSPISIGSLVIRAGSNTVLNAIRSTWPGLTALNTRSSGGAGAGEINQQELARSTQTPYAPGSTSKWLQQQSPAFSAEAHHPSSGLLSPTTGTGAGRFDPSGLPIMNTAGRAISPIYDPSASLGRSNTFASSQGHNLHIHARKHSNSLDPDQQLQTEFNPTESYNDVGFSPTILSVLLSFEELQHQLHELLSPAAIALTLLIQRMVGFSADFLHLAEHCHRSGQYSEGDRLLALRAVVEATIEADHHDSVQELVCGRGRRRLDNAQVLMQQVQVGSKELQRLAIRSRAESDFTGAQALDEVAADLTGCLSRIEHAIQTGMFSMLDSENGAATPEAGLEIQELIAREGTMFITSDYIFQFASGREGHSIGSLAIIAGAGSILRFIRAEWPGLTALSAPLYGQPQLPSHGPEAQWSELSFEMEAKATAGNREAQSPLSSAAHGAFNFRDAASLRLLGFDASSLRLAGFNDISVVTAGYTAAELRDANFSTEQLRQAGLPDHALRAVGYQTEQQADVLVCLYRATEGSNKWQSSQGWRDLLRTKRLPSPLPGSASMLPTGGVSTSGLLPQPQQQQLLTNLYGVQYDHNTGEVLRIQLSSNSLHGQLPSNLGLLTSIRQLVLSNNHIAGTIPASVGQLVNLENLHLDNNQLEGEIPKTLKNLEHLVVLKLEGNRLTGTIPAVLGGLQRLRRLDLSGNMLTGSIPARLTQLTSLQELLLQNNQLTGNLPEAIGQLTSLTSLQLQHNHLQGYMPSSIARLVKLTGLNIQGNANLIVDRLQLQRALPRCRIKL